MKCLTGCLTMVVVLTGCAASDPLSVLPRASESLVSEYSVDGSKFFEFRRSHLPRADRRDQPLEEEVITRRIEQVMEETGYCRDGFFELYRQRVRDGLVVRGECREAASASDRQRFPAGQTVYQREP